MKSRIAALTAAVCLMALAACSNGKFQYAKALGDISGITGVKTGYEEVDTAAAQAALTAAAKGPPLIVGFKAIRVAIPLAGQSGPSQTYASPDGVVIAMNAGFVTRVTGLGTVEIQDSYFALPVIHPPKLEGLNGTDCIDGRAVGTDGTALSWEAR